MYGIEVSERAIPRKEWVRVCGPLRKTIPYAVHDQSLCFLFPIYNLTKQLTL